MYKPMIRSFAVSVMILVIGSVSFIYKTELGLRVWRYTHEMSGRTCRYSLGWLLKSSSGTYLCKVHGCLLFGMSSRDNL